MTANFNPTDRAGLAIEVVLTSSDNVTSLFADSVVIQAQAYNGVVFRAVLQGRTSCLRCSSLRLAPFPEAAQRVKVDVVLPATSPVGLLWLASFSH